MKHPSPKRLNPERLSPKRLSPNGIASPNGATLDAEIAVYEDGNLYDETGIKRYLREMARPGSLFGDSFQFVPFVLGGRRSEKRLVPQTCLGVTVSRERARQSISEATDETERRLRRSISTAKLNRDYGGVLVASVGEGRAFQSTWYGRRGFRRMLRAVGMSAAEGFEVSVRRSGKGLIVEVESGPESRGLLTALNNTIGCIHLSRQLTELRKIAEMLRGRPPREVIGT
jgi:hypothetical protein